MIARFLVVATLTPDAEDPLTDTFFAETGDEDELKKRYLAWLETNNEFIAQMFSQGALELCIEVREVSGIERL